MQPPTAAHPHVDAVFFDFGGVITTSPFDAFAAYERRTGLAVGSIRRVNATNPDTNAWACLERHEIELDDFVSRFEREAAALGVQLDGGQVLACLDGEVRPEMARAVEIVSRSFVTALLTNNVASMKTSPPSASHPVESLLAAFDVIVESSVLGVRKPDPVFYETACAAVGVEPSRVVFLDDLGVNLKPARAMGMTTIKVVDPSAALSELAALVGLDLHG